MAEATSELAGGNWDLVNQSLRVAKELTMQVGVITTWPDLPGSSREGRR
jgi:hypothetical protein